MPEINLFRPESESGRNNVLTQEILDEKFGVTFDAKNIDDLQRAGSQAERAETVDRQAAEAEIQRMLNETFTEKRRESMLKIASRDMSGRPVRYYRFISWERLVDLLERGEHSPLSPDKACEEQDEARFKYFILSYLRSLHLTDEKENELRNKSLSEVLLFAFPEVPQGEIHGFVAHLTRTSIKQFIDAHVHNQFKKRTHTGSVHMDFTNYLGVSVGGVIRSSLNHRRKGLPKVYLEMVLPDHQVILQPEGVEGEKEVLVKNIKLSNVARICLDQDLYDKILLGEDSNILAYVRRRGTMDPTKLSDYDLYRKISQGVDDWRWHSPINEYLPISMAKRKASQGV